MHAASQVTVTVEFLDDGVRLTAPGLPGWVRVVRTTMGPAELARAILVEARTEQECASYARFRGSEYDAAHLEVTRLPTAVDTRREQHPAEAQDDRDRYVGRPSWGTQATHRPDSHDPGDWTPLADGRWRAPGGRVYREDTALVASVKARRSAAGLPITA